MRGARLVLGAALAGLAGWAAAAAGAGQTLPPPLASGARSDVPVATQILRWHMNDADLAALTFRSMDTLFTTRTVARSGPVWTLPRAEAPLRVSYRFDGKSYSAEEFLERTYTNALIVMKDGRIVHELYRNGTSDRTRFMGWSMTKSLTSVLIGCLVEDGLIASIDDPVVRYLPDLRGSAYDGVSIRQVLQMRSGVDYEERYDFANPGTAATNHINALVKNVARFADAAKTVTRAHPPGQVFQYKTLDTAVLGWLVERVSGGSVAAYTARRVWEPLGAEADGFYIMDGPPGVGREFSGAGFNATARDWARFGQMVLNGGTADGRRVVPEAWLRAATAPTAPEGSANGYGLQWWTMPGSDAFAAIGLQGQFVYVDPKTRTVIVKLSYFPPAEQQAAAESQAFFAAVSAWKPR